MMGESTINLLIVEDSANDATLLLAELKRKGQAVVHHRVETKDQFLNALRSKTWDAVVSDYVLPQFSGPEALTVLRQEGFDTPFIMVSGIYGEEEAVRMMKAGASDYVMKGNLSRLAPALQRELLAAQERRGRKRAEGAMQFLASIVESSADAIYGKNLENLIVSWNPAAERLFGYSAEEIIGKSNNMLFPGHRGNEASEIISAIRRGEAIVERETERLHKNGSVIPVSVTVSPVRNSAGEIIGASSIARDIAQQKQAEIERQELIQNLMAAAKQVRTLSGLLPICATCKRIRDDKGYWQQVEAYVSKHSEATFTHSICPTCAEEYERQFEIKD
jgi:PAS domain S-box-containing protein